MSLLCTLHHIPTTFSFMLWMPLMMFMLGSVRDSFSFCCISTKQLTEVWISELQIFKYSKSLISSQHLPVVRDSVIKVQVSPFDLAWASLVLLSANRSAVVLISTNQSSNCVASFPLKIVISCIKVFAKFVYIWAENRVSIYCYNMSWRGRCGADGQSDMDNLCSSCSM